MPNCYYTCNLLPLDLIRRSGYVPHWLGSRLDATCSASRREALSVHPLTCPYVTKLVATADALLGSTDRPGGTDAHADCLVVPGGCDAARRMGELLAAIYPDQVYVLPMPRASGPEVVKALASDLRRLDRWLGARLPDKTADCNNAGSRIEPEHLRSEPETPSIDYPATPRPGGVFIVAGPLSDNLLLRLVNNLGAPVSGLESCTSPDRWKHLTTAGSTIPAGRSGVSDDEALNDGRDGPADYYVALAQNLLEIGVCPRRSMLTRRDYLIRRFEKARPSSIIYARQSFCDPAAYDALLVAELAAERGLPYLQIEVDFPFAASGPLRTRVEAFLETQLLDEDLLEDVLDDLPHSLPDDLFDAASMFGTASIDNHPSYPPSGKPYPPSGKPDKER